MNTVADIETFTLFVYGTQADVVHRTYFRTTEVVFEENQRAMIRSLTTVPILMVLSFSIVYGSFNELCSDWDGYIGDHLDD